MARSDEVITFNHVESHDLNVTDVAPADWLLALIPAPLLAGAAVGTLSSLSLAAGIDTGLLPAAGLVGYVLFCGRSRASA